MDGVAVNSALHEEYNVVCSYAFESSFCQATILFIRRKQSGFLAGAWLTLALSVVGLSPPDGFTWTPRSMRSGAASAMEALGTPLQRLSSGVVGRSVPNEALAKLYIWWNLI